ncbi:hypothetical protein C2E31_26285 [Rhodopirellula baltica]|nr:hypothetical protein C2E31_26285 [Rhodopirellula baltica]
MSHRNSQWRVRGDRRFQVADSPTFPCQSKLEGAFPMTIRSNRNRSRQTSRRLILENVEARCLMAADGFDWAPDAFADLTVPAEISSLSIQSDSDQAADGPSPVLMVISNQDFWYQTTPIRGRRWKLQGWKWSSPRRPLKSLGHMRDRGKAAMAEWCGPIWR